MGDKLGLVPSSRLTKCCRVHVAYARLCSCCRVMDSSALF